MTDLFNSAFFWLMSVSKYLFKFFAFVYFVGFYSFSSNGSVLLIFRFLFCVLTYSTSLLGGCCGRFVSGRSIRFFSLTFGSSVTAAVDLPLLRLPPAPRQERFFLVPESELSAVISPSLETLSSPKCHWILSASNMAATVEFFLIAFFSELPKSSVCLQYQLQYFWL